MPMMHRQPSESYATAYQTVANFLRATKGRERIPQRDWNSFRAHLDQIPLPHRTIDAIHLWTIENLEHHLPKYVRPRVLHELERRFLPAQAHGRLLEAQFLGMISPGQVEYLLDELASREITPVEAEHLQKLIIQVWSRNLNGVKSVRIN